MGIISNMRILVVRIGRAGDIVMTTPALSAIFDNYPNAEVTVLTGPDGRRILKNFHSRLREIWVWNRSSLHNLADKRKIVTKLATHSFDIIFCFDTSSRIISIFKHSTAKFYQPIPGSNQKHSSAIYLEIVEQACGALKKPYYAQLPVDDDASKAVNEELMEHGISPDDMVIMLHPSYSGYTSNPVKKFLNRKNR